MRIERSRVVDAPAEQVWQALTHWRTHTEWQPSLASVEGPEVVQAGSRLVEVRASHGQRLTFDVLIAEVRPGRLVRASGKSRGVVSVTADLIYEVEPAGDGSRVTIALEADIPFVLLPLRHAVVMEAEKEIDAMLAALADREGEAKAS